MAITSESQLIDIQTIKSGCTALKLAAADFSMSGNAVIEAGETCSEKALSIDKNTLEYAISDIGEEMVRCRSEIERFADTVLAEAVKVYNNQVTELNSYYRELEQQAMQQNNNNG